jgi:hypothetical protein
MTPPRPNEKMKRWKSYSITIGIGMACCCGVYFGTRLSIDYFLQKQKRKIKEKNKKMNRHTDDDGDVWRVPISWLHQSFAYGKASDSRKLYFHGRIRNDAKIIVSIQWCMQAEMVTYVPQHVQIDLSLYLVRERVWILYNTLPAIAQRHFDSEKSISVVLDNSTQDTLEAFIDRMLHATTATTTTTV